MITEIDLFIHFPVQEHQLFTKNILSVFLPLSKFSNKYFSKKIFHNNAVQKFSRICYQLKLNEIQFAEEFFIVSVDWIHFTAIRFSNSSDMLLFICITTLMNIWFNRLFREQIRSQKVAILNISCLKCLYAAQKISVWHVLTKVKCGHDV